MRHAQITITFDVPDGTSDEAIRDLAVDAWVQVEDPRDRNGNRLTFDLSSLSGSVAATGSGDSGPFFDLYGLSVLTFGQEQTHAD